MPKAKVKIKKTVTLKMTGEEAQWLKLKMQYVMVRGEANREKPEDATIRKSFWNSLQV